MEELLKELEQTYLSLQVECQKEFNIGRASFATKTDGIRARLRNTLSDRTGEDSRSLLRLGFTLNLIFLICLIGKMAMELY